MENTIVDLTVPIEGGMSVYPGDPEVKVERLENQGYYVSRLTLSSHAGTHVDVPAHVFKDGKTLDQIPVELFSGRAYVVRLEELDSINVDVDVLLIYTGGRELSLEQAKKVKSRVIGVDSMSVGSMEVHKELLSRGVIVENLANLDKLLNKYVDFLCFPLLIKGGDGGPARAVAVVK
ncbi:MAG: cyclase family protein [Candidatus Aramenus sp.]|nr:cyclase family protein [Candidatus Aramenus sp.]